MLYDVRVLLLDWTAVRDMPPRLDPRFSALDGALFLRVQEGKFWTAVAEFQVNADNDFHACEVVYSICNSYASETGPDELFCHAKHRPIVVDYRDGQNRSLSVGDIVELRDNDYQPWRSLVCDTAGFARLEG